MNEERRSETEEKTPKKEKPVRKRKKSEYIGIISTWVLSALFLVGMGILLYPTVSNWWNNRVASKAIASYVEALENVTDKERARMIEAAEAYNARLARKGLSFALTDSEMAEYRSILDITGTGIMGYIQIPAISVNMPIYHTTEETVLQIAIGHLEGTSIPIGGESTHAALSGHRGLPSARLFTDLDRLREGDIFTITTFDHTVTYRVDQIRIVLPHETSDLKIVEGEDYCTLITCTPYGVNSHRMLVRGTRIENIAVEEIAEVRAEARRLPNYYAMLGVGIPILFILLVIMLISTGKRKPRKSYAEILDDLKKI